MSRTIEEGFKRFLQLLTPTEGESSAAKRHRASIAKCLEDNLGMKRFFRTGSFGNATSIGGFSDVDYFAELPGESVASNSVRTLHTLRKIVLGRFWNCRVAVRVPALRFPFGPNGRETTEVVPAVYYDETKRGFPIYEIPDSGGGWQLSSPDLHNAYVRLIDSRLHGKLRPLIRYVKAWKYCRNVPISSFYLELRITKLFEEIDWIDYSYDVERVIRWLDQSGLPAIQDPCKVSGLVEPCVSVHNLRDARSKLHTAAIRASNAIAAEDRGNIKRAYNIWRLFYNYAFPGYYFR